MKIRVAVNGYGAIGRRVCDAVSLQSDMDLVGVVDIATDWRMQVAVRRRFPIYVASPEARAAMDAAGLDPRGELDALLRLVDVVVDCTPKGVDAGNRPRYESTGTRAVFQGGSKHELVSHSFVASANYGSAIGLRMTRVVQHHRHSADAARAPAGRAAASRTWCPRATGRRPLGKLISRAS